MLDVRNYVIVTAAYWGFMLTDGALRMLVLLHFNQLGYTPFQLASLFLVYEFMGIVTNAAGGWIASRYGLKLTLTAGLGIQIFALLALSMLDPAWSITTSVIFVLAVQGISGVAKDLTKMSSKSAIKLVVPDGSHGSLYKWVAILTGSKNAIKGMGFFVGAVLLSSVGFQYGLWVMAGFLAVIWAASLIAVEANMGKIKEKAAIKDVFSKSPAINLLSAARIFLFGARDVWFVIGVPVFMYDQLNWTFNQVGLFMALWVIGYGAVQAIAPKLTRKSVDGQSSEMTSAVVWGAALVLVPLAIVYGLTRDIDPGILLIGGLGVFGVVFAINSAVHSYLILAFSERDGVSMNVGFYYSANALGRLLGTILSGVSYHWAGLTGCLIVAAGFLLLASLFVIMLRQHTWRAIT
jgi:MFS family permease